MLRTFLLSLFFSFSAAVASIALRLGVVRDEPRFPRTHQADATCGTATLSNYSASQVTSFAGTGSVVVL